MLKPIESVSVIGLGYVGLPLAATLAGRGIHVRGVDLRESVVERVNKGQSHFIEPDLDSIVHSVVNTGFFSAALKPSAADCFVISVPTPVGHDNAPDMRAVDSAMDSIAPALRPGTLVLLESTSPVGTTRAAAERLHGHRADLSFPHQVPEHSDVMVAYCPERILPGNTLRELTDNARIIGGLDQRSARRAHQFYSIFVRGEIFETRAEIAELVKISENAFRDVNIAFANELSLISSAHGIDVWEVIKLANHHPRVNILQPGPGVGGHCIPVDPWFIVHAHPQLARMIRTAREVNLAKQDHVRDQIAAAAKRFARPRVALLGLAYKPNIDDLRESPAVGIAADLARAEIGELLVVEPHVMQLPAPLARFTGMRLTSLNEAVESADVVAILVAHDQFAGLDRQKLGTKTLIDAVGTAL
jgi:UDP-N-acetyl-D-mannosaminuronic acid dehydrogenase